ncbi:uncharacterized protein A1O5_01129 [Cladophialophora psammophila CBS 110553]|uniref:DUF6594 domain-containing protein n=1 Tax=Cladophialophora psammophila CBS 110553 TaxID=1182543 RepID=W9XI34_9EURO|nr:uncharacterized protein A1O5_01129 [Cladophialophora psammophila CBS 110553]EXJ76621.1 hypothetical protein A1O5_01129 [Cladophialophora psammophila CBS 110553]
MAAEIGAGFPGLARLLDSDKDKFLMVFNRFDRLAVQNLVYLQSELYQLQTELDAMDNEDLRCSPYESDFVSKELAIKSWKNLREKDVKAIEGVPETIEQRRMKLIREIRATLKEYREAMLQQVQINNLDNPSDKTHFALTEEIETHKATLGFPDDAQAVYANIDELLSLRSPVFQDSLTCWVDTHLEERLFKHEPSKGVVSYYQHAQLSNTANSIYVGIALACMLLPVFALYAVGKYASESYAGWIELGLISACIVFSLIFLSKAANLGRSEIFASAAG